MALNRRELRVGLKVKCLDDKYLNKTGEIIEIIPYGFVIDWDNKFKGEKTWYTPACFDRVEALSEPDKDSAKQERACTMCARPNLITATECWCCHSPPFLTRE